MSVPFYIALILSPRLLPTSPTTHKTAPATDQSSGRQQMSVFLCRKGLQCCVTRRPFRRTPAFRQQSKTPQHNFVLSCLHLLRLSIWHMRGVRTWAVWADYLSTSSCPWATPTWYFAPYSQLFILLIAAQMLKHCKTSDFSETLTNSYSEFSKILVSLCRTANLNRSWYIPWFRWDSSHQRNSRSTDPWHSIYNGREDCAPGNLWLSKDTALSWNGMVSTSTK